jgi:cardiolipin synthase
VPSEPAAPIDPVLHIPFPTSGSYPARWGNKVRPLIDGTTAFRRIHQAIEAARHSVWLTVAFILPTFRFPDQAGSLFDVLDRAAARGLDVRVIFWRPRVETISYGGTFSGSLAERELLAERGSRFRIRWDRAPGAICHHQKSWLIDAGRPTELAFVGGMNLNPNALGSPGHPGATERHDLYLEITGPTVTDVHHNFVQRWQEASERLLRDGVWGHTGDDDLMFPAVASSPCGVSLVQIQRTVHAGCYCDGHPTPDGHHCDIAQGEHAIFTQYRMAIDAARNAIYIENQAIPVPGISARLEAALQRGVEVVALVPAVPEPYVSTDRRLSEHRSRFDRLAALDRYENFALVGIATRTAEGTRANIYIHAKVMLVDDVWATIGSGNLHAGALFRNTEMNASFWDPPTVRALRCALLSEHLQTDTLSLDDRAAFRLYRRIARENRRRLDAGDPDWQGLAFRLDAATYGE